MKEKKRLTLSTLAILLMFLATGGGTYEAAALQTAMDAWPEVSAASVRMLITLPCVTSMIAMIGIGSVAGKKISYRMINIIAMILALAGGLIPFFYAPNWTFVLVMRAFLGVGVGFYSLRNPLLVKTVPPEKLARYVGIGGMINNAFQIILNPLAGSLAQPGWQYSLLINLVIVIVGIIGILFLKEPEKERATESHLHQEKRKVPGKVWGYVLLQFLLTTVTYPVISGMSTFVVDKNLGSPVIAGTLISIYMAGGIVINLILPRLQKVLGNAMICAAFLITAAGSAIILFVPSFAAVAVGVFCCGLGFLSMFSIFQVLNGLVCQKGNVDLGSTLILAANQLGVFVSSYFITASNLVFHFGSEMENSFLGACAATAVLALLTFVFRSRIYPDHGK